MTAKAARKLREDGGDPIAALQRLAGAFPCLDDADGVEPWDRAKLSAWSETANPDGRHAARFVLSVEEPEETPFDLHVTLSEWGDIERVAFNVWAMKPWWA